MSDRLGKKIVRLRTAAGISQEKFAELLGVGRQTVLRWETGRTSPDCEKLVRMCELFHVSADEILGLCSDAEEAADTAVKTAACSRETERLQKRKERKFWVLIGVSTFFVVAVAVLLVLMYFPYQGTDINVVYDRFWWFSDWWIIGFIIAGACCVLAVIVVIVIKHLKKKKREKQSEHEE